MQLKRGFHSPFLSLRLQKDIRDDVKKYRIPRTLGRKNVQLKKVEHFQLFGSAQMSSARSEWKPHLNM